MKILNKLIGFLIILSLLVSPVLAQEFTRSTQHTMPYIVEGFAAYKTGEDSTIPISDARIYIKNLRTNYITFITSNKEGFFLFDLSNLQVTYPGHFPYQDSDEIQVYMNNEKIYQFQIGGREYCEYYGNNNCEHLAPSNGGYRVDFSLEPGDYIYYEPAGKEMTIGEWFDEYKSPLIIISAMILILAAAMVALYYRDKSKYRWMPGMAGILKWQLKNWVKAYNEDDMELADKLRKTLYKTADTITRKYIRSVENGDIEPGV